MRRGLKSLKVHQKSAFYVCISRSFKVINIGTPGKLVTSARMCVFICNRSHAKKVNSSKITILWEVPSLTPSFEENPATQRHKNFIAKN